MSGTKLIFLPMDINTTHKLCKMAIIISFLLMQASLVAQTVKNLPAIWETHVCSLGQEEPLEE